MIKISRTLIDGSGTAIGWGITAMFSDGKTESAAAILYTECTRAWSCKHTQNSIILAFRQANFLTASYKR